MKTRWIASANNSIYPAGLLRISERIATVDTCEDKEVERARALMIAAAPELLDFARMIGAAYPDDPGTSDLDNDQPVTITLGDVRRAWQLIAVATREPTQ